MQFKVFISYSTSDLKHVEALRNQLAKTPIKIFIAEHSVTPGQKLSSEISNNIKDCDLFILLWSENSKNSEWVPQEIGQAKALSKNIIPLILNENLDLTGFISGLKYIQIYKNYEKGLQEACEIAEKECNKKITKSKKQSDKQTLVSIGLGALFLWAINQK